MLYEVITVKVSKADYNHHDNTLTLNFYSKERGNKSTAEKPIIDFITLGNSQGERLKFKTEVLDSNPEYGQKVVVANVPEDWYYIRVYLSCKKLDIQKENGLDEFGNEVVFPITKGKKDTTYVSIDYRTARKKS